MRTLASRLRVTPFHAVSALLAVVAAMVAVVATQLGSSYADGHVKVMKLAHSDLRAAAAKTFLIDCAHQPVVRPRLYTLTCGDANVAIDHATWSRWGGVEATASARYTENTCTPNCAAGHYVHQPVKAVAHGLKHRSGTAIYTKITVTFLGKAPSWVHGHSTTFDVTPVS
jgi:hypothetical protein